MPKTRKKLLLAGVCLILAAAIVAGVILLGGKSRGRAQVYSVQDLSTDYYGDSKESSGNVTADKLQTVYLTSTQVVTNVYVKEGDRVSKGDPILAYDTTLSQLTLERKDLEIQKMKMQLQNARKELAVIKTYKPIYIRPTTKPTTKPTTQPTTVPTEPNPEIPDWGDRNGNSFFAYDGTGKASDPVYCWVDENARIEAELLNELLTAVKPEEDLQILYVIFEARKGNQAKGDLIYQIGLEISWKEEEEERSYSFMPFEVPSDDPAPAPTDPTDEPEEPTEPSIDYNSGYTAAEIAQMRKDKEKEIKELDFSIRMGEAEYKIMQKEMDDGKVYAELDGEVVSVVDADTALMNNEPMVKVSGGGGFYIEGTISETDRSLLEVGQIVTVMSWQTGMSYEGAIQEIGAYPVSEGYYDGTANPNSSYYPFTVFVDGSADLQENSYVSIQYTAGDSEESQSFYLMKPFILNEGGKSYVYVLGEGDKLEKREVVTGKALWGDYLEILSGLSREDYVAFPYAKESKPGAAGEIADISSLYESMY